jgi:hypothetical protein
VDSMFDSPIPEIRLVGGWSWPAPEKSLSLRLVCKLGDFFVRLLFGIAVFLLEEAGELVLIAPEGRQVLVSQLAPLLFHHSRKLLPVTRELIPFQDVPPMAKEFSDVNAIVPPPAMEGILFVPRSRTSLRPALGADGRVGNRPEITSWFKGYADRELTLPARLAIHVRQWRAGSVSSLSTRRDQPQSNSHRAVCVRDSVIPVRQERGQPDESEQGSV